MIETMAQGMREELVEMRRKLHKTPETAFQEYQTSAYIKQKLTEFGIPFQPCAETGIVALIEGEKQGKTVLLRADIDGLPIQEESGVDFASEREGFMHACGHDVHTACLLGAAKILYAMRDALHGAVKLVFQPAEEGVGGALPMIEAGVMEQPRVDAAFALHVEPLEEVGNIQLKQGPVMASPDDFEVIITGVGGHGAAPQNCVDPILTGAMIVNAYQTIVSRCFDPMTPCVVSVCSFHAGNCTNAIPETAILTGTARSLDPQTRTALAARLEHIAKSTAESMGAKCAFKFKPLYPPLINHDDMNAVVEQCANELNLIKNIVWLKEASMAGDDFSYFCERVPGAYFKLGVGNKKEGIHHPIHSPFFKVDEDALPIGAAMMAKIAVTYLNR